MNTTDAAGGTISASAIQNPYLFTGRQLDEETGLYYYRARHYSADLKRFIQRDPLEYVDGPNASHYARSAPTREADPLGLRAQQDTSGVTNAVPPGQTGQPVPGAHLPKPEDHDDAASDELGKVKWRENEPIYTYADVVNVQWRGTIWDERSTGRGSDAKGTYVFEKWSVYFRGYITYWFTDGKSKTIYKDRLLLKVIEKKRYLPRRGPSGGPPPTAGGGPIDGPITGGGVEPTGGATKGEYPGGSLGGDGPDCVNPGRGLKPGNTLPAPLPVN